jgi:hypothetical protein
MQLQGSDERASGAWARASPVVDLPPSLVHHKGRPPKDITLARTEQLENSSGFGLAPRLRQVAVELQRVEDIL